MILVLLGTQNNSFSRLLTEVEKCIENNKIKDEVIVQAGYTIFTSDKMKIFDFIPMDELENLQKNADLIITHGGVGSIVSSIKKGKKVIAVPRLHKYKEHVNNHQIEIVESFDKQNFIIGCNDVNDLEKCIDRTVDFVPKTYECGTSKIIGIIENYIENN